MGPMTGPSHGMTPNTPMANPRSELSNMSLISPPALVMDEHPNMPAKKRRTSSALSVGAPQTPEANAVNGIKVRI